MIDDHYVSDDPIRSDQRFDGDPDPGMGKNKSDENLPNFMAEESVDYLGQYSHESDDLPENAEPTEGELAAIKASADHSNQLSEEYTNNSIQSHHDYVEEKYEETSEEDYIDPIDSEQMGHDVEMLKGHANKVVDCVDESVYNELDRPQSLTVSTTKKMKSQRIMSTTIFMKMNILRRTMSTNSMNLTPPQSQLLSLE